MLNLLGRLRANFTLQCGGQQARGLDAEGVPDAAEDVNSYRLSSGFYVRNRGARKSHSRRKLCLSQILCPASFTNTLTESPVEGSLRERHAEFVHGTRVNVKERNIVT
jgi:hypothetical protein